MFIKASLPTHDEMILILQLDMWKSQQYACLYSKPLPMHVQQKFEFQGMVLIDWQERWDIGVLSRHQSKAPHSKFGSFVKFEP